MRELVAWFLGELGNRVGAIRRALDAHDASRLRMLAHQLAGAASGYGFDQIGEAAREVESRIRFMNLQREALAGGIIDDGLEDDGLENEVALSALTEKTEDLITLCRRAIDGGDGAAE